MPQHIIPMKFSQPCQFQSFYVLEVGDGLVVAVDASFAKGLAAHFGG